MSAIGLEQLKCHRGFLVLHPLHVYTTFLLLQQNEITSGFFEPCLGTQNELCKTKSSEAICAVVTNSQREETLRAIRIVSLLRNLTNCCKTELWVKDGVLGPNTNKKGDRVDLLTVVPAIAIPTIPTRCRLASIMLWISTRQFYSKQNRKIFTPRKTAQLCQLFSLSSRRTQKGLLHSLP